MSALKGVRARLRALLRGRAADRDLQEEIALHLELETAANVARGLSVDEARRRALAAFGGVGRVREEHRDVRGGRWLADSASDARFAFRTFRRAPALLGAAVLTIALGVAANTAIFSAVNAVILQPLPFAQPDRLLMLWEENPEKGWYQQTAAPANVLDWREQVPAFADVAAWADFTQHVALTGQGEPRRLETAIVTGNFFAVLGVRAQAGRTFTDAETWRTGDPIAVVSDRVWREEFGADPALVGRTVQLDGRPVQVVGVAPPGFGFPGERTDVWRPTAWNPDNRAHASFRRAHWMRPVARLRPGATVAQASAQLQEVVLRLQQQYPETNRVMGAGITPLQEFLTGDVRRPLLVLLGAVALLLLIACANVGNLLLVHAAGRGRETALRLALGAGRGRLVRQALVESLALSLVGGSLGLLLGWWGSRALVRLQPEGMLPVQRIAVDWTVVLFALAITTASGLLFGLAPALWGRGRAPGDALREGGRAGSAGRGMRRWGDWLVTGEVALALLLTVGAGLLVRSFAELRSVHPGFEAEGLLAATVELRGPRYAEAPALLAFQDALVARARALPGVRTAAITDRLPLTDVGYTSDYIAQGRPADGYGTEVTHRSVSPGYFEAMGIPLRAGRDFAATDHATAPAVAIVNETLARGYFGGDAVGQRIAFDREPDSTTTWYTIVGVVGDEHQRGPGIAPQAEAYHAIAQETSAIVSLVVRTDRDLAVVAPPLQRIVAALDRDVPIAAMRSMTDVRAASLARERFLMVLLLLFAGAGLLLAVVGVYGVLAHQARQRTREMGIRIALGAQAPQVRWLVVRHGLRLTATGLALGAVAALVATRSLGTLLFRTPTTDPATYAVVAAVLVATGAVASWLPALRASRADPAVALRAE